MRVDSGRISLPTPGADRTSFPRPVSDLGGPSPVTSSLVDSSRSTAGGFADLLMKALEQVNGAQLAADRAVESVATGEADNLHDVIIAVETADLTLRLTAQITQRAVEAYREVSRMQL